MIPEHYARDIVEHCEILIESLLPVVMQDPAKRFGGPLGTTFLVAMSTPMILLPIERMLKPAANRDSVADDRTVDESMGRAVARDSGRDDKVRRYTLRTGRCLELRWRTEAV
jgi:hypothetical protein